MTAQRRTRTINKKAQSGPYIHTFFFFFHSLFYKQTKIQLFKREGPSRHLARLNMKNCEKKEKEIDGEMITIKNKCHVKTSKQSAEIQRNK